MVVATPTSIRTQILTGTYPSNTIQSDGSNVFAYEQNVRRRRYPSCEIVAIQPQSTDETKKQTILTTIFEVRFFIKTLGIVEDEITTLKSVEDEIKNTIESMILDDHKLVFESKQWSRRHVQRDADHPSHQVSVLRISVRRITPTTATSDARLIFDVSVTSGVNNEPLENYTYTNVYDVDISSGYREILEPVTDNPDGLNIPLHYSGVFDGRIIFNVPVKNSDLGSTGDKLNKLEILNSNGEKGVIGLTFTDKTMDSTPLTLREVILCRVESVQRLYHHADQTVFRVIGRIIKPTTITTY